MFVSDYGIAKIIKILSRFNRFTVNYTLPHYGATKPRPICATSDVLTYRRNMHHRLAPLWRFFRDSGVGYKTTDFFIYLLIYVYLRTTAQFVVFLSTLSSFK